MNIKAPDSTSSASSLEHNPSSMRRQTHGCKGENE